MPSTIWGKKEEGKNASAFEHFPTSKNSSILNKETMKAPKPPNKIRQMNVNLQQTLVTNN